MHSEASDSVCACAVFTGVHRYKIGLKAMKCKPVKTAQESLKGNLYLIYGHAFYNKCNITHCGVALPESVPKQDPSVEKANGVILLLGTLP